MSLLLVGSQCAGTGIIGLLTLGRDCILQEKQKIGNKYSVLMIGYGDRGHHHSKQSPLGKDEGCRAELGCFHMLCAYQDVWEVLCASELCCVCVCFWLGTGQLFLCLDWKHFKQETEE